MEYLNFGWIIHGLLAAAQGPTSRRDLIYLGLQNIRSIVRMQEGTISGEANDLVDLFEPVADGAAPSLEQIERMVWFMQREIRTWEHPVVVTCRAGLGRTGTILACYMVFAGYKPDKAVSHIRELRPGSIETGEQEAAVYQYDEMLKDRERERRRIALEDLDQL